MNPPPNMLRHAKSGGEGVDGTGGVGEDREFGDFKSLADGINVV